MNIQNMIILKGNRTFDFQAEGEEVDILEINKHFVAYIDPEEKRIVESDYEISGDAVIVY